jgi:ribonuclease R
MKKKKSTKVSPNAQIKVLKGRLDISRSGMGFVIVEELQKDILVKPNDFGKAMHGDIVRVQIAKGGGLNRRVEGKIVDVAERKQTRFTGDIHISRDIAFFEPSGNKPIPDFFIPNDQLNGAGNGDRVIVKLVRWDANDRKPIGRVESVISAKDEADMAMKELLIENGFALEFEELVLQEMNELNERITKEELERRKDFRDVLTFTIDPIDARDFDDALSIRELENDVFEIGVHIADVSHFVKPQSLLDQEAYQRATSVYLPDRVNPMLPEKISNELCSLRPHEDKFTFSCVFEIDRSGKIKKQWIGRTLIHSDHRFTYEDVQTIIETKSGTYCDEILLLNQLAQKFRKDRFDQGAINFSSTEVRFQLDEDGKPIGIIVKESKEAHKLIEEFMLLANRTVAEYVSKIKVNDKPLPFPYRIHDTPDDEKLKPFVAFARKFGYHFDMHDERQVAASFNNLLKEVHGKPEQHVLEQLGIRTMAKAVYTAENIGHYGLGFEHYCHFTSPIRRYPDVMVHRILQDCLDGNPKAEKNLETWCKHCSERERAAMETERAGNKYKQVEFMKQYVGEEFDGIISGVSSFGFWVETVDHKCEGLVSLRDINVYDEFFHEESDYALVGAHTKKKFRMGDKIRIQVLAANLTKRQLDYAWVAEGIGAIGTKKLKSKK